MTTEQNLEDTYIGAGSSGGCQDALIRMILLGSATICVIMSFGFLLGLMASYLRHDNRENIVATHVTARRSTQPAPNS